MDKTFSGRKKELHKYEISIFSWTINDEQRLIWVGMNGM